MCEGTTLKILILEESEPLRKVLRQILESRFPSAVIEEVLVPKQMLEFSETFSPEIVIVDIELLGWNGLGMVKRMKESYPSSSILILSNHDLPEYRKAAMDVGASCFLCKGKAGPREIEEAVLALLSTSEAHQKG